MDKKVSFN
jgi:hypothetical protein